MLNWCKMDPKVKSPEYLYDVLLAPTECEALWLAICCSSALWELVVTTENVFEGSLYTTSSRRYVILPLEKNSFLSAQNGDKMADNAPLLFRQTRFFPPISWRHQTETEIAHVNNITRSTSYKFTLKKSWSPTNKTTKSLFSCLCFLPSYCVFTSTREFLSECVCVVHQQC